MKDKELRRALIHGKIIKEIKDATFPTYLTTNDLVDNLVERIKELERYVEMLRKYLGVVYKYIPEDYIAVEEEKNKQP